MKTIKLLFLLRIDFFVVVTKFTTNNKTLPLLRRISSSHRRLYKLNDVEGNERKRVKRGGAFRGCVDWKKKKKEKRKIDIRIRIRIKYILIRNWFVDEKQ